MKLLCLCRFHELAGNLLPGYETLYAPQCKILVSMASVECGHLNVCMYAHSQACACDRHLTQVRVFELSNPNSVRNTGMTSISLHMQWPLTSQLPGSVSQREQLKHYRLCEPPMYPLMYRHRVVCTYDPIFFWKETKIFQNHPMENLPM
jgi:hypothetical protein